MNHIERILRVERRLHGLEANDFEFTASKARSFCYPPERISKLEQKKTELFYFAQSMRLYTMNFKQPSG
jgi:hypothetical protein